MNPVDQRVMQKLDGWVERSESRAIKDQRTRFKTMVEDLHGKEKLLVYRIALTSLPRQLFSHSAFQSLKTLQLTDCPLEGFPVQPGRLQQLLESVFISRCGLKEVPAFIAHLPSLKRLELDGNQITRLPGFLNNLDQLKFVNVENNAIKEVPYLGGMRSLEVFQAANNEIERVHIAGFVECPNLKGVDLNRNRLRALNMGHLGLQLFQWAHQKV